MTNTYQNNTDDILVKMKDMPVLSGDEGIIINFLATVGRQANNAKSSWHRNDIMLDLNDVFTKEQSAQRLAMVTTMTSLAERKIIKVLSDPEDDNQKVKFTSYGLEVLASLEEQMD